MTENYNRNDLQMLYDAVENSIQFPDEKTRTQWEDIAIAIFHASPVSDQVTEAITDRTSNR